jgi:hypothetical protein
MVGMTKGANEMKRFVLGAGAAAAVAALAFAPAGIAAKAKTVAFTATYSGTAVVQTTDSSAAIQASGTGSGTNLGASKITGNGSANTTIQPCAPFTGPGTMTAANGTKLAFAVTSGSQGCGDDQGQVFSLSGKAKVTSGAGKLAKAKGTLRFSGVYDRGAGTFTVKFTGTLTL